MLANLSMPEFLTRPKSVELQQFPTASAGSTVILHPRFATWLKRAGLDSAPAIMALSGEIICGHPDRHVIRVVLSNGRVLFLKKEHLVSSKVRFRNWRDGFGSISRCEREAITLQNLEEARLPCPQWLAYGQTDDGRSFLLLDNLAGGRDLTDLLNGSRLSTTELRFASSRIGAQLAEYHEAGFSTPDLSAKHVFLSGPAMAVTVIDWQSVPAPCPVAWSDRVRALARLHASLPQANVTLRDRLILLRSYLRSCPNPQPRFSDFVRSVERAARSFRTRSSVASQADAGPTVRLVWVDNEQVVTIPELARHWPAARDEAGVGQFRSQSSFNPVGRLIAWLRETPWRSAAAINARLLVQLQTKGIPAPRLLAYGQTLKPFAQSTSFLLTDRAVDAMPISAAMPFGRRARIALMKRCGKFLALLHRSGVAFRRNGKPGLLISHGSLMVNAPEAVIRRKRVGWLTGVRDLSELVQGCGGSALSRTERMALIVSYFGRMPKNHALRILTRRIVRGVSR
ncbi:MAG: lipopolysaccharide kinase InaA family protein [Gemmataceae bacterium]